MTTEVRIFPSVKPTVRHFLLLIKQRICERTPAEALCVMTGASTADAAANMERGSVPSSIELRGSVGADDEEEEDEEVLPLRAPRRVLVSVT